MACILFSSFINAQTFTTIISPDPTTYSNNAITNVHAPNGNSVHITQRCVYFVDVQHLMDIPSSTVDISAIGFSYTNTLCAVPAGGTLTVYMANTMDSNYSKGIVWSTATVAMVQVYSGPLTIPTGSIETTVDLPFTVNFDYTGHSLYVAYDYVGGVFDPNEMAMYKGIYTWPIGTLGVFGYDAVNTDPENLMNTNVRPVFRFGLASGMVGIKEKETNANEFSLFPNPCRDFITINNNASGGELSIYNLLGEKIRSELIENQQHHLSLKDMLPGIYLADLNYKNNHSVKKLVIEK